MYSGSDSNESQKYAQWPLNPASFQNVPGEQVDWAALAQQWIIMKEAGPPPIPGDQPVVLNKKNNSQEGGEAEMDVETEKEVPAAPIWASNETLQPPASEAWNWNTQNQSWNWNNSWTPPVPPPAPNISGLKTPLLPTPNNYAEPPESTSDNAIPFGSHHTTANPSTYWNNSTTSSKHIKPHNKRYSKVNVPIRASAPLPPMAVAVEPAPIVVAPLDTAKRKQLPAWIREGLEKMEKDKLKQIEKEKEEQALYTEQSKQPNKETMEILKTTIKERQRSRFESDGENSEEETKVKKSQKSLIPTPLSHDDLMLKVRRSMTEILLTVTNRQIEVVCKEELQRFMKNRKASEAASAPSGANLRGRLGLGMYGGEDSGSSSEDDREDESQRNLRDSDDDLKNIIKRKMTDFQKTEREIENKLEVAERRKEGTASRSASPDSNDNDSQVDAWNQDRKYYQHDTRQKSPHSKSTHDKQKQRSPSTSSQDSAYSNNRSKNSRRSSTEESKDSYKRSKKKSSTPEKRNRTTSLRYSKSPLRRSVSRRDSNSSSRRGFESTKKKSSSKRSRSRSYSRSRRSRSSSYKRSKRTRSRERSRRSRSSSRSRYSRRSPSSSRSERRRRRRSRSDSSGRGKRSHRH